MEFQPTLVEVLKLLRNNSKRLNERDIVNEIKGKQEYVSKALEELIKRNIITKEEDLYYYHATPMNEEFSNKILAIYDEVARVKEREQKKLLIRGLLSLASPEPVDRGTLLEVLENEGCDKEEINAILEEDVKQGYVEKVETPWPSEQFALKRLSGVVVLKLMSSSSLVGSKTRYRKHEEKLSKDYHVESTAQEYLIANYPPKLAELAREYLEREKPEVKNRTLYEIGYGVRGLQKYIGLENLSELIKMISLLDRNRKTC